jgi:hypothetical protein
MSWLEALTQAVAPEYGCDEAVDWNRVSSVWNTGFPDDYREFMATYGAGSFNDSLHVIAPPSSEREVMNAVVQSLADGLAWLRDNSQVEPPWDAYPKRPGLVQWGTTNAGDDCFWLISGDEANVWPVVTWNRGLAEWVEHPPGMARLIVEVVTRPSSDRAVDMISSAPRRPVRFINERLIDSFSDPWPDLLDP